MNLIGKLHRRLRASHDQFQRSMPAPIRSRPNPWGLLSAALAYRQVIQFRSHAVAATAPVRTPVSGPLEIWAASLRAQLDDELERGGLVRRRSHKWREMCALLIYDPAWRIRLPIHSRGLF
jgi:hypothetical protein